MKPRYYIYRYKETGISVQPSRHTNKENVWDFAINWLKPASLADKKEAVRLMHEIGEVVPEDD